MCVIYGWTGGNQKPSAVARTNAERLYRVFRICDASVSMYRNLEFGSRRRGRVYDGARSVGETSEVAFHSSGGLANMLRRMATVNKEDGGARRRRFRR